MNPFFHLLFELRLWKFLYLELLKFILMGSLFGPFWSAKILEFWKWKLWNQNFFRFDSGNIHIEETKKTVFNFSIELRINSKIFRVISWSTDQPIRFHSTDCIIFQRIKILTKADTFLISDTFIFSFLRFKTHCNFG